MTLFENRIFEDVIKVRIFWDEIILGLGWTPNLMTGILKKEGTGRFETHRTQRIKQCEADTGVDDHWQPPAAGREAGDRFSESPEGISPAHTSISDFWPTEL